MLRLQSYYVFSKVTYKVTYKTCIGLNHTAFNQIENTWYTVCSQLNKWNLFDWNLTLMVLVVPPFKKQKIKSWFRSEVRIFYFPVTHRIQQYYLLSSKEQQKRFGRQNIYNGSLEINRGYVLYTIGRWKSYIFRSIIPNRSLWFSRYFCFILSVFLLDFLQA